MKPIIYVAAPVSGDPVANAHRAVRWVRWFVERDPSRIYIAPWVAEVLGFANETLPAGFYQHVLDDDMEVVTRLDGLVGVGGKWSGGMLQERAAARAALDSRPVLDMTQYTEPIEVPPEFSFEHSWNAGRPRNGLGKGL